MLGISDPSKNKLRLTRRSTLCLTLSSPVRGGRVAERSLWALLAFMAVTTLAVCLQSLSFMAAVPETIQHYLGDPPPANLISVLLSAYFVSSVAVAGHGIIHGTKPGPFGVHLALRSTFYLLYFSAEALAGNLVAVFVAGLILSILDHLRARAYERSQARSFSSSGS